MRPGPAGVPRQGQPENRRGPSGLREQGAEAPGRTLGSSERTLPPEMG